MTRYWSDPNVEMAGPQQFNPTNVVFQNAKTRQRTTTGNFTNLALPLVQVHALCVTHFTLRTKFVGTRESVVFACSDVGHGVKIPRQTIAGLGDEQAEAQRQG